MIYHFLIIEVTLTNSLIGLSKFKLLKSKLKCACDEKIFGKQITSQGCFHFKVTCSKLDDGLRSFNYKNSKIMFSKLISIGFRSTLNVNRLNLKQTTAISLRRNYCKDVNDKNKANEVSSSSKTDDENDRKELVRKDKKEIEEEKEKVSDYDLFESVEDVRARLRKESEVCYTSDSSQYMYPAGFDYQYKNQRIMKLERTDVKPFKDFNACTLIQSDVLIVGSGMIGISVAYWLRELATDMISVNVIDRDFKHLYSNTGLSASGLQQQFTNKECIELSQHSAEFLRTVRRNLNVFNKEPPDIDYCPTGNLILSKSDNVEQLLSDVRLQNELGQKTILLSKEQLKKQYPWLNSDDIELGSIGLENEGHFNSQALLRAMKVKAENLHTRYWECEFVDFNLNLVNVVNHAGLPMKVERVQSALVRDKGNELFQIYFDRIVICAGAENVKFGKLSYYDHF